MSSWWEVLTRDLGELVGDVKSGTSVIASSVSTTASGVVESIPTLVTSLERTVDHLLHPSATGASAGLASGTPACPESDPLLVPHHLAPHSVFLTSPVDDADWPAHLSHFTLTDPAQSQTVFLWLSSSASLKAAEAELVPRAVERELFWARYAFFRTGWAKRETRRREVLAKVGTGLAEDEPGWGDEEEEGQVGGGGGGAVAGVVAGAESKEGKEREPTHTDDEPWE